MLIYGQNLVTSIYRLSKMKNQLRALPLENQKEIALLVSTSLRILEDLDPRSLSNLVYASVALKINFKEPQWELISKTICKKIDEF